MVDYAQFYVDPRPMASQFSMGLRDQARWVAEQQQKQAQAQSEAQQQQFQNTMKMQENDRANAYLGLAQQAGAGNQQKMAQEVAKRQLEFMANAIRSVDDENSYQNMRAITKQMTDAGMLGPEWYKQMPEHYDAEKVREAKKTLQDATGMDTWTAPAPIPGGRGALGITNKATGETKTVVGQDVSRSGGAPGAPKPQTTNDRVMTVERMFDDLTRDYIDPEFKMYRQGPPDDPDLYRRLGKQALQAKQKDVDLVQAGKEPHYLKDLINEAATVEQQAEVDWGKVQLPTGVTQPDVEYTAKQRNISVKEVLRRIGAKGEY